MGSAWQVVSRGRWAAYWVGQLGVLLIGACGGGREDAPAAALDTAAPGVGAAGVDTASAIDTAGAAAVASGDTAPAKVPDTAASGQRTPPAPAVTQPSKPAPTEAPTKPAPQPTEPAEPTRAAAPKPKPTPSPRPAATPEPADSPETAVTAQTQDTASAQDTATAQDTAPQQETETAAAPMRDPYHQPPKDTVSQEVYDGWKQYNLNCARCHGEDVLGTTIAPHLVMSLKPDGPINTQEAFVQVVCAGRPEKGMPSWCALGMEPAKINQIYAYVKGRSEGEIGPGRPALREGS
jgi:hypothetical protein